jgi:peptide/nickel transport system substrate-binding protein
MRMIRPAVALAAALTLTVAAAACSSSSGSGNGSGKPGSSATPATAAASHGGNVTMQWVGGYPNFIFPLMPATNTDGYNVNLQEPMWPYLVYSGNRGQSTVSPEESLYSSLNWSNNDATFTVVLKPWKWSDGSPITSRDFLFTYDLLKSMGQNWIGWLPGLFPTDVKSVQITNSSTFVVNLTQSYNPTFYEEDVLNQVPLLPQHAWDKESVSGAIGNYDETAAGAKAVVSFLQKEGSQIGTFTTNPLWKVVDGPWTLSEFTSTGTYGFVPNKNYSGPDKPYLSEVVDAQYTTEGSAFDDLLAGSVQVGPMPFSDLKQIPRLESEGYSVQQLPLNGTSSITPNFYAPTVGKVFQQLYIRQAMEDLIDRPEIVSKVYSGYADPGNGPVPVTGYPNLVSSAEKGQGMYPYSPSTAISLLKAHGWTVTPNGASTCADAGTGASQCGAGIAAGQQLAFQLIYPSGIPETDQMMAAIVTWEEQAGIKITLKAEPFNTMEATVGTCNASSHPASTCDWQMAGGGYDPYPLDPTGSGLFNTDAPENSGGYSTPEMDQLINATEYGSSPAAFAAYENYATQQLPSLWLPLEDILNMYKSDLGGIEPGNPFSGTTDPELWFYTKS